jgi:hypothetical protein
MAASTKGTLFDQAGTAVAKVATNNGELRSTLRNYTSANVFMPAVSRGQVDFGVANQYEVLLAMTGRAILRVAGKPISEQSLSCFHCASPFTSNWIRRCGGSQISKATGCPTAMSPTR